MAAQRREEYHKLGPKGFHGGKAIPFLLLLPASTTNGFPSPSPPLYASKQFLNTRPWLSAEAACCALELLLGFSTNTLRAMDGDMKKLR
jgi:hypothetical protein